MIAEYDKEILGHIFKCKCGLPLLMFGCGNSSCDNYYIKRLKEEAKAEGQEGKEV